MECSFNGTNSSVKEIIFAVATYSTMLSKSFIIVSIAGKIVIKLFLLNNGEQRI